jgi:hypothetical protein
MQRRIFVRQISESWEVCEEGMEDVVYTFKSKRRALSFASTMSFSGNNIVIEIVNHAAEIAA